MNCSTIQQELISYIYQEMEISQSISWQQHIENCATCAREQQELTLMLDVIAQSTPSAWYQNEENNSGKQKVKKTSILFKIMPIAAVLLFCFALGFALGNIYLPKQTILVNENPHNIHETLLILVQNQKYRNTLSQGQWKLIQKMERSLVQDTPLQKQMEDLHELERLQYSNNQKATIVAQKDFIKKYPNGVLLDSVYVSLAKNYYTTANYSEASKIYKTILDNTFLDPLERGEYIHKLASCYYENNEQELYIKTLVELEKDSSYGTFRTNAVKELADYDFKQLQFLTAYNRYQQYLQNSEVKDEEAKRKMEWIRYHERDNFYPLMLYVQAQEQGVSEYYGLNIIINQYPDSPLAFPAFKMYMQNYNQRSFTTENKPFPQTQDPKELLKYLENVSTYQELDEVAKFAKYWQAKIWQKHNKDFPQALRIYQEIIDESSNYRLQELAYKNIHDIEQAIYIGDSER